MLEALSQPYLQNALAAGAIAACIAALVGYFVVLRGVAFAAHALAQIGFAGAAGAVLVGVDPLWGLVGFALLGALGIGRLNPSTRGSDVTIALVLVASLGTGALFLALNTSYATQAFTLLFGTIVGVSRTQVAVTLALALTGAFALAFVARPLLFATVSPDVASGARRAARSHQRRLPRNPGRRRGRYRTDGGHVADLQLARRPRRQRRRK